MISKLLYAFEEGAAYVKHHPQILFALLLVIVLPLAFLYSANQFLEAGQANQNKLQKDRIGILHDSFASLLQVANFEAEIVQPQLEDLVALNPDITKFRIARFSAGEIVNIAAADPEAVGQSETEISLFQNAAVRQDESIIFEYYTDVDRRWQSFRAVPDNDGNLYFIFTESSHAVVDEILQERKNSAYIVLGLIYVFVLAIAYWLTRITDYRYLYQEAQQAIKTKDLFTNMIAHELRAPLTAIKGYASMISESRSVSDEDKLYATRITDSSERLITIVSDLLDVARIQSGKLKLELVDSDVAEIITAVCEELQPSASEKSITLTPVNITEEQLALIDPKRLHQALTNLVSNAIKYTKHGSIELSLTPNPDSLEIRVKDTGMGISASDQKQLFAPFFRVQSDDVSEITGTGLGMWITRQLVELMGATIGVESIKGVGTHIVLSIPKKVTKKS